MLNVLSQDTIFVPRKILNIIIYGYTYTVFITYIWSSSLNCVCIKSVESRRSKHICLLVRSEFSPPL